MAALPGGASASTNTAAVDTCVAQMHVSPSTRQPAAEEQLDAAVGKLPPAQRTRKEERELGCSDAGVSCDGAVEAA